MNKRTVSLLIVLLMILSAVPVTLPVTLVSAGNTSQVTHTITKVNAVAKEPEISTNPTDKIEPLLLDILEGKSSEGVAEINGQKFVLVYIISKNDITQKIKKLRVVGKTEIGGSSVYMVLLPVKKESIKVIMKIAAMPQVEAVTRANPVKPIEIMKDIDSSKSLERVTTPQSKFARNMREWKPSGYLDGKKVESFKELLPEKLKELQKNSPARNGEITIAKRDLQLKQTPQPEDFFAIYHHGSWATWNTLGITGEGVNVAVIDSGVDFGNPDLQDAYAVDTNPESPYYGWPIAFDGNSMIYYLILGATFPDFDTFSGYLYSWYANTSFEVQPFIYGGYFGIGYKGNYTTVFTTMSLANIPDDYERTVLVNNTLAWIGNVTNILLVDDDGGDNFELFYETALNNLGVNYTYYEVPYGSSGPNATVMSNYSLVIWFTGGDWSYTLRDADVGNLTQYLENGGKLWLISDDYLWDRGLDNFAANYLHVADYMEDFPAPTVVEDYTGNRYYGGEVYWGIYYSPTDMYADYIFPDANATPLLIGYTAYAYSPKYDSVLFDIKLPLNKNLEAPTQSGTMKLGLHPDLALWYDWYGGFVLVTDPHQNATYDTVYVDLAPSTVIDFNKDVGHTKDNPVVQLDFWNTFTGWFGQDGYADLSGGLIYFIADGQTPIPYSDKVAERWGLPLRIPGNGDLVAFMIGTVYTYGGDHGTLCAAAVGARGRTFFGLTFGNAISSKIIAEGSLYTGGSWIDYVYFAVEGYDGVPGTGDEAQVVSNSYGISSIINKGYTWADRFLYYITQVYAPTVTFFFAAGNGGPGYGTVTSEGASPFGITVGASVEWGYRALFGYDDGPWGMTLANYGDVADFSNRGPNALGQPDPDVLAVGEFALGSLPVNEIGDGFWSSDLWSGTSLATPMAAGIAALVYEAYYNTHGRWPTAQEVREILMSTAENVNHDIFSQGAGFLNAYRAVQAAMNMDGIVVSPSMWQAGRTEYQGFANVLYPGESDTQIFEVKNMNPSEVKDVNVSAEIFEKIGEVEFDVVGGSWNYYRIDQYIPNGTDLMKITLYTNYTYFDNGTDYVSDAFPWFRVWDVTYVYDPDSNTTVPTFNLLQQSLKEGTVASAMLGNPLEKFHDAMYIQIRDIWQLYYLLGYRDTPAIYPAKVKLEFYRRVPWKWVKINENSLTVPADGSATFEVTLTVPENASYGIYEGAIYLKYDGVETTIPISVVVASPTPEFQFGGNATATGLYDNSNVYGYMDWSWRREQGDWRLYYFNVSEVQEGTYILADVAWDGTITDINLHILGPAVDEWSMKYPEVMGSYYLKEIGRSEDTWYDPDGDGYGLYLYQTSSGVNEELIAAKAVNGLNALWLHNVLFDGNASYRTFYGKVGLARVYPEEWLEVLSSQTGEKTFTVTLPEWAGNIVVNAVGFSTPLIYSNVIAPPTDESDFYTVNVTNSPVLDVSLTSIWDDLARLDLDLYVYYNQSGTLILVGASYTPTSDERVTIKFPIPGQYVIEVHSYDNPVPGEATYDLEITTIQGNELQLDSITEEDGKYKINVKYNLTAEHLNATEALRGIIFIGTDKNPMLFQIPVTLTPYPYDIEVSSVSTSHVPDINGTYNISVYITNVGMYNASEVAVKLLRDEVPVDTGEVTLPSVSTGETYRVDFLIPIRDTTLHKYRVVVEAPEDMNTANNEAVVYARGIDKTYVPWNVAFGESIGEASLSDILEGYRGYRVDFTGEHGAVVTVVMKLPADVIYYRVRPYNVDLVSTKTVEANDCVLLYAKVRLHSPGYIVVEYETQRDSQAISTMNMIWYLMYHRYIEKFDELYNKSMKLGIDNETIREALYYRQLAEQYYEQASSFGSPLSNPIRSLAPMRKAYLNIMKAVEILSKAIEEAESS
ncbi:S8 family serine peptidase [Thermococcus sp.]